MLKFLIPTVLIIIAFIMMLYDRNKAAKTRTIKWLSKKIFRDVSGKNESAERLHQATLGFLFIFCIGISSLFLIGLFEEYY